MSAFEEYPYSNYHEFNLDWIVREIKNLIDEWKVVKPGVSTLQKEFAELKAYVENYFNNLDLSDEVSNKIDQMVADGTFAEIIQNLLTGWITPQMYGAKGDGVTDDSTAFNAMFVANPNGSVHIPAARYKLGSVVHLYANVGGCCVDATGAIFEPMDTWNTHNGIDKFGSEKKTAMFAFDMSKENGASVSQKWVGGKIDCKGLVDCCFYIAPSFYHNVYAVQFKNFEFAGVYTDGAGYEDGKLTGHSGQHHFEGCNFFQDTTDRGDDLNNFPHEYLKGSFGMTIGLYFNSSDNIVSNCVMNGTGFGVWIKAQENQVNGCHFNFRMPPFWAAEKSKLKMIDYSKYNLSPLNTNYWTRAPFVFENYSSTAAGSNNVDDCHIDNYPICFLFPKANNLTTMVSNLGYFNNARCYNDATVTQQLFLCRGYYSDFYCNEVLEHVHVNSRMVFHDANWFDNISGLDRYGFLFGNQKFSGGRKSAQSPSTAIGTEAQCLTQDANMRMVYNNDFTVPAGKCFLFGAVISRIVEAGKANPLSFISPMKISVQDAVRSAYMEIVVMLDPNTGQWKLKDKKVVGAGNPNCSLGFGAFGDSVIGNMTGDNWKYKNSNLALINTSNSDVGLGYIQLAIQTYAPNLLYIDQLAGKDTFITPPSSMLKVTMTA